MSSTPDTQTSSPSSTDEEACIFCRIVDGRAPATIIREWDDAIAFRPLNPVTPGHVLVVPRVHARDAGENAQSTGAAAARAAELIVVLPDANLITSKGTAATQTVWHTHLHVVPRDSHDGLSLPWHEGGSADQGARVIHSLEERDTSVPSIFLAGPTPRTSEVESWRPEAIALSRSLTNGRALEILVPEPRYGWQGIRLDQQYGWEFDAMSDADVIAFWIPRTMRYMPALTTNVEWGRFASSGRTVVGWPVDAERNRYLAHDAQRLGLRVHDNLTSLMQEAIDRAFQPR